MWTWNTLFTEKLGFQIISKDCFNDKLLHWIQAMYTIQTAEKCCKNVFRIEKGYAVSSFLNFWSSGRTSLFVVYINEILIWWTLINPSTLAKVNSDLRTNSYCSPHNFPNPTFLSMFSVHIRTSDIQDKFIFIPKYYNADLNRTNLVTDVITNCSVSKFVQSTLFKFLNGWLVSKYRYCILRRTIVYLNMLFIYGRVFIKTDSEKTFWKELGKRLVSTEVVQMLSIFRLHGFLLDFIVVFV